MSPGKKYYLFEKTINKINYSDVIIANNIY
jgi:hypothetical protein